MVMMPLIVATNPVILCATKIIVMNSGVNTAIYNSSIHPSLAQVRSALLISSPILRLLLHLRLRLNLLLFCFLQRPLWSSLRPQMLSCSNLLLLAS